MNPKYPVYVISKDRANNCITNNRLSKMNVPHYVVVEPQDENKYKKSILKATILTLPFSNLGQGSIPARNWVWEDSINRGFDKHWIMDDNIYGFYRMNRNEKIRVKSGTMLKCAEDFVDRYENVPIAGLNYQDFCVASDPLPPYYLNTRVYSCLLIENSLSLRWRGRYNEDTDICLRALKEGYCTILFNAFLIGKTTTMTMKGGNTDNVYIDNDNRLKFAESLQNQHPDCVRVVWKFNRWHHQVDYSKFKNNILIKKKGLNIPKGVNNYGMKLVSTKDM